MPGSGVKEKGRAVGDIARARFLATVYRHNFPRGEYAKPKPTFTYDPQHMSAPPWKDATGTPMRDPWSTVPGI